MLRKIFIAASLSLPICSIVMAEPAIEVVSQMPSGAGFVMQSPAVDCRYDFDHATEMKSVEGSYSLLRKSGQQRIHQYSCQVRIDNTKALSEIAFWGGESLTSLVNYAQCDLQISTNFGSVIYSYDMTPVFALGGNSIVQRKVTNFTNIPSNSWIASAGFICTATEDISAVSVLAIGVKYQ